MYIYIYIYDQKNINNGERKWKYKKLKTYFLLYNDIIYIFNILNLSSSYLIYNGAHIFYIIVRNLLINKMKFILKFINKKK